MFLIDRQSVCKEEVLMDVSTFTARRQVLGTPAGDIAYTEFGRGPAALFVHGIGTSGLLWRHVIEEVSDTSRCIAIDLPTHGGTPARADLSATALAQVAADLCDGLGLGQLDLVGNDTGGAVAQIFAARQPGRLRSLTLTNCDSEGNFPPPDFAPVVGLARHGELAEQLAALTAQLMADPAAWADSPLSVGYQHPEQVPFEVRLAHLAAAGGTPERARDFERLLASIDDADLEAVSGALRALDVPTLLVWGTGDDAFGIKWAYQLRDMIPGAREVIEVDEAMVFFPEERPGDLVPHLRAHWGR
jgi:pimeloyl-ACP methyl ester carboxylesterase